MMEIALDTSRFPALNDSVRAHWAPVYFEPISGSGERLVVAVAVVNKDNFHLEAANALKRLYCFYGDDAVGAIRAIEIALQMLERDLVVKAIGALAQPNPGVTGIEIGDIRETEGATLAAIAQRRMEALSSLYKNEQQVERLPTVLEDQEGADKGGDRLPFLVCEYVRTQREGFAGYFSRDLREGQLRRSKGSSHKVIIDFSGSKLVANFGTLKAGALTSSVNLIKRRLWDLKVDRDKDAGSIGYRDHEMIVHKPANDDPQMSDRQLANLKEAFEALEEQADQEELRLRALPDVKDIGDHVLRLEMAA